MFKGIQKTSLIDYPGVLATTLFTGGCNFRCPWCYNTDLVKPALLAKLPDLSVDSVKEYLLRRQDKIVSVCITGGEHTLWGDELIEFLEFCINRNFQMKLDTNGYCPDFLEKVFRKNLVNYVAMDVKSSFENYSSATGITDVKIETIQCSIRLIQQSGIPHQFRMTQVSGIASSTTVNNMERWLGEKLVLQRYRNQNYI